MSFTAALSSYRLNSQPPFVPAMMMQPANATLLGLAAAAHGARPPVADHPSLLNLGLLVFEAVMEVVCVSLPGYVIARYGMFDTENQKFVANLNVSLFTPCLSSCPPPARPPPR